MTGKRRVGILISGRGSNMQALIKACQAEDYPAQIAVVISNVAEAPGLAFARDAGIETAVISHKAYNNRENFDAQITAALHEHGVEIVCNAGFMRLHSPAFVNTWCGKQINIHPSLLPSFRGLHPQRQALAAGVRISGCTVHFVSEDVDAGAIIAQAAVPVLPTDDEDALSARILKMEHRLYPLALKALASGVVQLRENRAVFAENAKPLGLF